MSNVGLILFSCSTQLSMKNSLLINMKLQTIVGMFVFSSKENFMFNSVEHEKSFIFSRPGFR